MAEGNSAPESTPQINPKIPETKTSQETQRENLLKNLNEKTSSMTGGYLGLNNLLDPKEFPKAMILLNKNTALLTEMANSEDSEDFVIAVDTAGNFLKFYNKQDQDLKDFLRTSKRYGIQDFTNFSASLLNNSMERIEKEIKSGSVKWESKSKLISAVVNLARDGEGTDREKAVECLVSNLDVLISKDALEAKTGFNDLSLRDILDTALECGNQAQVETIKQWAVKIATENSGNLLRKLPLNNTGLIKWLADVSQIEESSIQKRVVSAFGINAEETVGAWTQASKAVILPSRGETQLLIVSTFNENLSALSKIESKRPGIGKVLQEEFGINDFARYPEELLIAQYDQRDLKDNLPYGVIIYPRNDRTGAFYHGLPQFRDLSDQLQGKYRIVIWEVKNLPEIVSALNKSRHKYGQISFAIIGGHGSPEDIAFGKEDSGRSKLEKTDLGRPGADSLRLAFVDNPTIILNSCSTGQLGGIGQEISKIGANVIAPTDPTNLDKINASISESGQIKFDVKYRFDVPEKVYSLGENLEIPK